MGSRAAATWTAGAAMVVLVLTGACGEEAPPAGSSGSGVEALVERLERGGIECVNLIVEDPPDGDGGGSVLGVQPDTPVAVEVGYCVLEGAQKIDGVPAASRILVFEDDTHIRYLRAQHKGLPFPVVYGETWRFYVEPPKVERAKDVQRVLGGKIM